MDQEGTYKWIQDRLRDLHAGSLSESDRQKLYELAKNDPFLQDALEGYQTHAHYNHAPHLRTLSQRIHNKSEAKRRRLFPSRSQWMVQAVAASLLLILVTWAVIYYVGKENNTVLVSAENQSSGSDEQTEIQMRDMRDVEVTTVPPSSGSATAEMKEETPGLRANAQSKAKEHLETEAKEQEKVADVAGATYSPDQPVITEETEQNILNRDEGLYANQMDPDLMSQRATGQVLDAYGQPVPGAFIAVENSNLITTSNQFGQFEIFLPEKITPVEITSTGYADTIVNIAQGKENVVIMLAHQQSNAGVTRAMETYSMKAEKAQAAPPAISFVDYMKTNSRYPIMTTFTGLAKVVIVEFEVRSSGRPAIKSVSTDADKKYASEAVRLLEKGPDWQCDHSYPCELKYIFYFL